MKSVVVYGSRSGNTRRVAEAIAGALESCGPVDLVAVEESAPAADDAGERTGGAIRIDPVQVQNMGVVSSPATLEKIARRSRTVGILDYDADRVAWVNTKFEGWIEKVHVTYRGQQVRRGEPLFEIYSPELLSAQEEYLQAVRATRGTMPLLLMPKLSFSTAHLPL